MSQKLYLSGEICPKTSDYIEVDQYGNIIYIDNENRTISIENGEKFPPTREENLYFKEAKL